jgi:hypothetical protein
MNLVQRFCDLGFGAGASAVASTTRSEAVTALMLEPPPR